MQIKQYSDKTMLIHLEDTDDYDVTDDNGVDLWLSEADVNRIASHSSAKSEQEIRPAVMRFAKAMENVLQENDYKGDWYGCDFSYLFGGVGREYYEAKNEWDRTKTPDGYHKTARELIDVANFCMMFYDNLHQELRKGEPR